MKGVMRRRILRYRVSPAIFGLYSRTFLYDVIRRRRARAYSKKLTCLSSRRCCFVCLSRPRSCKQLFIPTVVDCVNLKEKLPNNLERCVLR